MREAAGEADVVGGGHVGIDGDEDTEQLRGGARRGENEEGRHKAHGGGGTPEGKGGERAPKDKGRGVNGRARTLRRQGREVSVVVARVKV